MNEITLNGTTVKIETRNGKTCIDIKTQDADVILNDSVLWSKFDKPEYEFIPPVLREFIHKRQDYLEVNDATVIADVHERDFEVSATVNIPRNLNLPILFQLDYIESVEELENEFVRNYEAIDKATADKLMDEFKALEKEIIESAKAAGYKWQISHSMNNFVYAWWNVVIDLDKWNEEAVFEIWKKVSNFNAHLNKVLNEYEY